MEPEQAVAAEPAAPEDQAEEPGLRALLRVLAEYRIRHGDVDGMILWESNAIIRYLCCKHDQGGMYPADIQERAEAEKWMDWHLTVAVPKTGPIFRGIVHTPEDQRDHAAMKECGEELTRIYQFVEKRLEGRDYIMGDRFTMVDCALGVHVNRYYVLVEERPAFKYMDAWYERLKARPPFDTHVTICP